MADDVLVEKLFNYICGSGGFVEISVLLKHSSPLGSRKSELEARNWLKTQTGRRFVVVKDCNGEIAGVRIDSRKKICRQYRDKGFCRRAQGECKFWHICKDFIEDNCTGKCSRSHNFFDDENHDKTRELGLDKHPNGTVKNIVVWSLPQVCQLYKRGECVSDECFYLHVCDQAVRGSSCNCSLSHNLTDSRNKKVLKKYDLIPHQSMTTEFVRCNIIVPKEQKVFDKSKFSSEGSTAGNKTSSHGPIECQYNTPKQGSSSNISSSSKQSDCECNSQVKTRNKKKNPQPNRQQDESTKTKPICKQPDLVNNLANNSISPSSENKLEYMNIQAGEDSGSSSDENELANVNFKTVKSMNEDDLNVAKRSEQKSKMPAPSSKSAIENGPKGGQSCSVTSQKRVEASRETECIQSAKKEDGNVQQESKMTAPSSDRTAKAKVETSCDTKGVLSGNNLNGNARKKIQQKYMMPIPSSDNTVKANVNEVKTDPENCLEASGDKKGVQSSNKLDENAKKKSQQASNMTAPNSDNTVKANVNEVKTDPIGSKKRLETSCDTKGIQSANKLDEKAQKKGQQESKMTTLSLSSTVKTNVKKVKTDPIGNKTRTPQQKRLETSCDTKSIQPACKKVDPHDGTIGQQESKMATPSSEWAIKSNVVRDEKDPKSGRMHNAPQQKGLEASCDTNGTRSANNLDGNFSKKSQQESKVTAPSSDNTVKAKVKVMENDAKAGQSHNGAKENCLEASGDTKGVQSANKLDGNAKKKSQEASKIIAPTSIRPVKAKMEGVKKDPKGDQTHSAPQQERIELSCDTKSVHSATKTSISALGSTSEAMKTPVLSDRSGLPANYSSNDFVETWVMGSELVRKDSSSLLAAQDEEVGRQRKLSVSSSCSSVQDPNKCTVSKKAVFDCIVKEYNGTVPFNVIAKRHDLFPNGCGDIEKWFKARKDSFLLTEKEGTILEVSVFCRRAGLCFKEKCLKNDCPYFHVCREYVAGFCRRAYGCQRNHSFQYDEDRKLISKFKLDGLTEENLRKVLQLSMPQVCLDYNDGCCTRGPSCGQVHICKEFIKKRCEDEEDCGLQHERAFAKTQTNAILHNYGLEIKGGNVNPVLRTLLVCENISSGSKDNKGNTTAKNVTSKESNKDQPILSKGAAATNSCEPSELKVFECLCKDYDCSASFPVICKRTDLFPPEFKSIESWFRKKKGSFLITEDDQGMISQVDAYSTKARLCFSYNNAYYGDCKRENCSYLHVCKEYITDSCSSGATCSRNHLFQDQRDKALLSKIKLDQLTDEQLRKLVLSSTPQICVEYNNGMCDRGESCTKIHMCSDHLKKCCREGYRCSLPHDAALNTEHAQAVLERYQLGRLNLDIVTRIILICDQYKESTEGRDLGHILKDTSNAPICSDFLLGKCKNGLKCSGHHCPLPFHWQYTDEGEWKSFTEEDNEKLEKLYCDVKLEECSATGFQLSFESDGFLLLDEKYDVNILLDNKLMIIQKDFEAFAQLRRLSTVSYVTNPGNTMATEWIWYWKDENEIWRKYGQDTKGKDLQPCLEKAFLYKKDDVRFQIAGQDYTLTFVPDSDMIQTNLKYGTTRKVRRRPAKVISKYDICQLKRSQNPNLPANKQQGTNSKGLNVPSHWSPMPSSTQYKRVPLAPLSDEFTEVEELFRKSIRRSVVIISIKRVQNPFMWEKYQRKKDNMSVAKTGSTKRAHVNEMRLFHGTDPDIVEAICKQNFDWRLHGKNATKYGQGSYFALSSSYSDSYAKEDLNSSKFMFVAKVLVGLYTTGNSSYRRPPSKNPSDPASDLYDSCVNDRSSPTIFVVFDTDQFYPEYIIEYSSVSQTVQGNFQQPAARAPAPKVRRSQAAAAAPPRAFQAQSIISTTRHRTPTSSSVLGTSAYSSGSTGTGSYSSASSARYNSASSTSTPYTGTSTASYSSIISGTSAFPVVSSRHASSRSSTPTSVPYYSTASTSTYTAYNGWSNDHSASASTPRSSNSRSSSSPTRSPLHSGTTQERSSKNKRKCLVM